MLLSLCDKSSEETKSFLRVEGFNKLDRMTAVCCDPLCKFIADWRYRKNMDSFLCYRCIPHTPGCAPPSPANAPKHAFKVDHLGPVVASNAAVQPNNIKPALVMKWLRPYLAVQPTSKFCSKVYRAAVMARTRRTTNGRSAVEFLYPLCEELTRCGYHSKTWDTYVETQIGNLQKKARAEHDVREKDKPKSEQETYAASEELQAEIEKLKDGPHETKFYDGIALVFPWAAHAILASQV